MRLIEAVALAFINTFGITQPDARTRRRASWFIVGLLALVVIGLGVIAAVLLGLMRT